MIRTGEILGAMLMTEHNPWFYQALMADMRAAIGERRFEDFAKGFHRNYAR